MLPAPSISSKRQTDAIVPQQRTQDVRQHFHKRQTNPLSMHLSKAHFQYLLGIPIQDYFRNGIVVLPFGKSRTPPPPRLGGPTIQQSIKRLKTRMMAGHERLRDKLTTLMITSREEVLESTGSHSIVRMTHNTEAYIQDCAKHQWEARLYNGHARTDCRERQIRARNN